MRSLVAVFLKFGIISAVSICLLLLYLTFKKYNVAKSGQNENKKQISFINQHDLKILNPEIDHVSLDNNNGSTDLLTAKIRRIAKGGNPVLVTLINDAYLPFAYSWLCNTREMGVHKLVLFIVTDSGTEEKLNRYWPEVTTYKLTSIEAKGDQTYSHAGYVRLMIRRSEILMKILESNTELFLFEVDCLWVSNPLPDLRSHTPVDIIVTPVSERPDKIAGGFLYMYPTSVTKNLWKALTSRLLELEQKIKSLPAGRAISEGENDQVYISQLIKSNYGGVKYKELTLREYPDGKWYSYSKSKREQTKPYIINNNWVLGNQAKIKRAKMWGHWFLAGDNSCDMEKVIKVTQKGP